jgi:hypothetical protein
VDGPKRDLGDRINPDADPAEFLSVLLEGDPREDEHDGDEPEEPV